jgi:hypothetical protein
VCLSAAPQQLQDDAEAPPAEEGGEGDAPAAEGEDAPAAEGEEGEPPAAEGEEDGAAVLYTGCLRHQRQIFAGNLTSRSSSNLTSRSSSTSYSSCVYYVTYWDSIASSITFAVSRMAC